MITFLSTYWGSVLFLVAFLYFLGLGIRFSLKYRSLNPLWFMLAAFLVISVVVSIAILLISTAK
jgi:hypothetical protein